MCCENWNPNTDEGKTPHPSFVSVLCNLVFYPGDHSNAGASCVCTSHSAQSILWLGCMELAGQLCNTAHFHTKKNKNSRTFVIHAGTRTLPKPKRLRNSKCVFLTYLDTTYPLSQLVWACWWGLRKQIKPCGHTDTQEVRICHKDMPNTSVVLTLKWENLDGLKMISVITRRRHIRK